MKTFLGFLPLNTGMNLLVATHLTQDFNSFLVNVTELNPEFPYPWLFCMFCNWYSALVWFIVFNGTNKESSRLIKLALYMWITFTIVWFISAIFSVTENLERYVCLCQRCPESFWFFTNDWHVCLESYKYFNYHGHLKTLRDLTKYNSGSLEENNKTLRKDFGLVTMCIAMLLMYFIFGIVSLSSYLKELKCKGNNQGKLELKCIISKPIPKENQNVTKVFKSSEDICKDLQT